MTPPPDSRVPRERWGCVDVAEFPLQLLLRRRPDWRGKPAAVVDKDSPLGFLRWCNRAAREQGVLPGLRYAAGLALCRDLLAAEVPGPEVTEAVAQVAAVLRGFSPRIEPHGAVPGVFWLDASGLGRLYRSPAAWARRVRAALQSEGLRGRVAVGFTRFGSYAAARSNQVRGAGGRNGGKPRAAGVVVFRDRAQEAAAAAAVPLADLDLDPGLRDQLAALGVATVGEFLSLPAGGIAPRFGGEAAAWYRLAADLDPAPLRAVFPEPPLEVSHEVDDPETSLGRVLAQLARLLDRLLEAAAARGRVPAVLTVELGYERRRGALDDPLPPARTRREVLRPAAPTADRDQWLELIRLRFEAAPFSAGVERFSLEGEAVREAPRQLTLLADRAGESREAAARALARLRAEYGDGAVVRARLRDAHLPAAQFVWEPCAALPAPRPGPGEPVLVRRHLARPRALYRGGDGGPGGVPRPALKAGPVARYHGPFLIDGRWWHAPLRRAYYFLEVASGAVAWAYWDRDRAGWRLRGWVE